MELYDIVLIHPCWLGDLQEFKTQSLQCLLNVYEIKDDGKLILVKNGYGRHENKKEVYEHVNFTGEIKFYNEKEKFSAWCVKGTVKEIVENNSDTSQNQQ